MADSDAVFQEAVEALREGNKTHARELLTGLLKTDQNNATYWVWMSATVDTTKERIYCLQTAFKLDPKNAAAKRGLILHGALPPDETIQPFPVKPAARLGRKTSARTRKAKTERLGRHKSQPGRSLGWVCCAGCVLIGAVVFGFIIPNANQATRPPTSTPGPSPTLYTYPHALNATGRPVLLGTSAPLSDLLPAPYTPTPLYVNTPRSPSIE